MLQYSFSFNLQIFCSAYDQVSEMHPQNIHSVQHYLAKEVDSTKADSNPWSAIFCKENPTLSLEMKV